MLKDLYNLRKDKFKSARALSRASGVDYNTISLMENEKPKKKANPTLKNIVKLARVLDISTGDLSEKLSEGEDF